MTNEPSTSVTLYSIVRRSAWNFLLPFAAPGNRSWPSLNWRVASQGKTRNKQQLWRLRLRLGQCDLKTYRNAKA
jgi:hypothetical protein